MSEPVDWETKSISVEALHLDEHNPRLMVDVGVGDEIPLLRALVNVYDAFEVAKSIASYGFFPSEPLIAVEEEGKLVVVEGNRRLTALKLLRDEDLRREVVEDRLNEWEALAGSDKIPSVVPTVIVQDRDVVAPLLGFRHISGIQEWEPWAKARFIANLVDRQGQSFERAAASTGEDAANVRALYRNYHMLRQARDQFGMDVTRARDEFGVFTRAMNAPGIRDFMKAPAPKSVVANVDPLPVEAREEVGEALSLIFGDEGRRPVISDSRELTTLGRVLASPSARQILRDTRDLTEADEAAGGTRDRLVTRLTRAASGMRLAATEIPEHRTDPDVISGVHACSSAVSSLSAALET